MSAITIVSNSLLGVEPQCAFCGAGATKSFNWSYVQQHDMERIRGFELWKTIRRGALYRCKACEQCWHLDGNEATMTHIADDRLPLVLEWSKSPITLSDETSAMLGSIGPTPPDIYGNGAENRTTPCSVETKSGEHFDRAIVCVQLDAPVQDYWNCRLASEIARILPSPYALPLEVRLASSRAEEMRMGFSPSLIEMPDRHRFVLNGRTNFFIEKGYQAAEARTVTGSFFSENPPPDFVNMPKDVVYFIADGEPGWIVDTNEPIPMESVRKRKSWVSRIFRR